MALLLRKRLILIEAETSYGAEVSGSGDDNTLDGADAVLVRDLSITPQQSDVVSRDLIRPYFGASQQLLANTRVECTFSVELAGGGQEGDPATTVTPRYSDALLACGLSLTSASGTHTYKPSSSSTASITIHYNVDGILHKVTGCRGNVALNANVGEIPTLDFTFIGVYNAPTSTAAVTPNYTRQSDPLLFKNGNTSSFSLYGFAGALQSFSFDLGNSLVYRELVGGTKEVLITDRSAGGSVSIEAPPIGTGVGEKDFFDLAVDDDEALGTLQFTHGADSGNIIQFTSSKVDLGDIAYGDSDGIAMLEIPYTCVPESQANTDFSLIYT